MGLPLFYYLAIVVKQNNIQRPFFRVTIDTNWIYALSEDKQIIEEYVNKLLSHTHPSFLDIIEYRILENLSPEDKESNLISDDDLIESKDIFFYEGIVNKDSSPRLSLETFERANWSFLELEQAII